MVDKIIVIVFIIQCIFSLISIAICFYEYKVTKDDFGTGMIFVFLFMFEVFFPVFGVLISVVLCVDCISNIKKARKKIEEEK